MAHAEYREADIESSLLEISIYFRVCWSDQTVGVETTKTREKPGAGKAPGGGARAGAPGTAREQDRPSGRAPWTFGN